MEKPYQFSIAVGILRDRKNMSQEKFAFDASLDRKFISNIELGKSDPGFNSIYKMAKALGMKPSELVEHMEENLAAEDKYWLDSEK